MTSQGSPYPRFRRALLTGNVNLIVAAAHELPRIGLEDALKILEAFAAKQDPRYSRAASRFAARVTLERRLGLAEARYVLALAEALPTSPDAVGVALRALILPGR